MYPLHMAHTDLKQAIEALCLEWWGSESMDADTIRDDNRVHLAMLRLATAAGVHVPAYAIEEGQLAEEQAAGRAKRESPV